MKISKDIRFRVYITFMGMCVFGIMILYKGFSIQFKEGKELRSYADSLHTKIEYIQPERGNIYSEDGSLLSSSIPQFDLRIDFQSIKADTFHKHLEPLSKKLAAELGDHSWTAWKEILETEYQKGNRYFLLKKKASYAQYLNVKKMEPFCKGQNKGGFIAESQTKRINPYGLLANRVIGLWRKNAENVGIEREYNLHLSGMQGQRIVRRIAGGTWMPIDGSEIEPENGRDIVTTLDVNIQDVAENALLQQLEKEQAAFGTCIVMEVNTGKIKAIANLGRNESGEYAENFNYAIKRLEPGSTFKLISLIALMRDKLIRVEDKVNCQGGTSKFGPYTIRDSHAGLGVLTIKDAFAQSSNVAFAKLIHENYKEKPASYWYNLHALGLDTLTGLGMSGEVMPKFIRDSVSKGRYSLAYLGMGYQVLITPLHTCMVYNAIANNGKMMKPYLVNSVQEYGKEIISYQPQVWRDQILDSQSIVQLKEVMNEVVETGTGKALKNPYYKICGKTGTAQVADKGIRYSDRVYHGSFVGFFPKENPQYTICVVIRTKKGSANYYGGQIALPVFKEVANRLYAINMHKSESDSLIASRKSFLPMQSMRSRDYQLLAGKLNMPALNTEPQDWVHWIYPDSTGKAKYQKLAMTKHQTPDVQGMGLRDAIFVLENAGFKVIPVGQGKVKNQSVAAGTQYQKGQFITIQLG